MVVPDVVHWLLVPLITVKLPLASTLNFVLSYFNDIVLVVFKKGFENVKLFCFVVNNVVDVAFKLFIDNVEFVDKPFKFVNTDVDVEFKLLIDVVCPLTKFNIVVDVAFKILNY